MAHDAFMQARSALFSSALEQLQLRRARTATTLLAATTLAALLMGGLIVFAEFKALALCVSLLACVFIMRDFRVGVVCLVILMPISASMLMPRNMGGISGMNPLNILLVGTLASLFARGLPAGGLKRFLPPPLLWLYLLPIALAGLLGARHVGEIPSIFHAEGLLAFDGAGGYLRDMLLKPLFLVLFGLLVGAATADSRKPGRFLMPMLLSVWLMAAMTVAFVILSGVSLGELASSRSRLLLSPLGFHANDLGRLYAMAYALMLFTVAETREYRLRITLVATMAVLVLALTLTFSRSAFFGFVLVNLLFLASRRKLGILLIGGTLFLGLLLLLPGAVYERIGSGWGAGLNAISAGRVDEIWLPLLPELANSPLYGQGLGSILWSDAMRAGRILEVTHPHNAYLQAALDMGVAGLLAVLAYFIHVWKVFRRLAGDPDLPPAERGFFAGAAAGLVVFLVTGISGSSLVPSLEHVYLWLAIGMMYGHAGRDQRSAAC